MRRVPALFVAFAFTLPAFAAEPKFDAEARAQTIAPFLSEQTIALAYVDVTRLNADALLAKAIEVAKRNPEDYAKYRQQTGKWISDFTDAGGKEIYIVFDAADLPLPSFAIVPLGEKGNPDKVAELLRSGVETAKLGIFEVTEKIGNVVFAGGKRPLARMKESRPVSRPEVAKAFAAAEDTAGQFLLIPTADARRVVEELVPKLPKKLGGGPSTVLTNGVQWAAIGAESLPNPSLRMTIQSKDAPAARALNHLLGSLVQDLARIDPHYGKLAALASFTVGDDRVMSTVNLGSPGLGELLTVIAPKMMGATEQRTCMNNFKLLAVALHTYHDANGRFPAVANFNKDGKPLLSWRVHLLPYLNQAQLYQEFRLDEPWDSEHNKKLISRMPEVFRCPGMSIRLDGKTTYLGPVGTAMMFTGSSEGVRIADITDGTSNTIFIVDADDDHAVIWTKPDDLRVDAKQPEAGLVGHHDGIAAAFADGSVHLLPKTIAPATLNALFTRNGGEVVQGVLK